MKLISRDKLKDKLDRGDSFKLVMVLGEIAFRAKRIPGSINCSTPAEQEAALAKTDEIVVYCASATCPASILALRMLAARGYENVRRYAGGLDDWESAGYALEGELA